MKKGKTVVTLPFLHRIPSSLFAGIRDISYAGSKRISGFPPRRTP